MLEELGKQYIIIDFSDLTTISTTNIYYKHNEIGTSSIKAKLVNKRKEINLTNCKVIVNIINEKGEMIVDYANIIDVEKGIISIDFIQVALQKGISFFELTLLENNEKTKKSAKIAYRILDSLDEDAIIESERYPILVTLIKQVEDLENLVNQNETTRNSNEEVRKSNEVSRQELFTDTINTVNNKIVEINTTKENLISTVTNKITEANKTLADNTKKTDDKIVDIQNQLDTRVSNKFVEVDDTISNKITDVQGQIDLKIQDVDNKISEKLTSVQSSVDEKIATVDEKFKNWDIKVNEVDSTIIELNEFKDNTVSTVSEKVVEIDTSITSMENRFNALSPEQSSNAEVQLARTDAEGVTHASLHDRLLKAEIQGNILWETVEG